jgi:hypothetical protein
MDGKLMAKKATPAFTTPGNKGSYDPPWYMSGETTPAAIPNAAAMRNYTRNAPYMAETLGDPQTIKDELYRLTTTQGADDPETEYRIRILRQALQDIYNMSASTTREFLPGPTTAQGLPVPTTPRGR